MKFRKTAKVTSVCIALAMVLAACAPAAQPAPSPAPGGDAAVADEPEPPATGQVEWLIMATGGAAGTYYPFGGVIANVVTNALGGQVSITANTSGASVANARALFSGDVELALMQNDILYYAYTGTGILADDGGMPELRTIATLYPEVVQLVATVASGITSVHDLVGQRVVIGDAGSGTEANALHVLAAHGISPDDFSSVQNLSFGEASTAIQNGNIDAAFVTAGGPTPAVTELSHTVDIVIVPIEGTYAEALLEAHPFYVVYEIPDAYYDVPGVSTIAVLATLVTTTNLSEDTVYNITRAMFENQQEIAIGHSRGNDLSLESAVEGISAPLHPGAERFFRSMGVID